MWERQRKEEENGDMWIEGEDVGGGRKGEKEKGDCYREKTWERENEKNREREKTGGRKGERETGVK